ncbi:hypothetical protein CtesDRAFT_PD2189 [Comamonas testosteroni KF-1]|uniref:Uncharacterized protein n=1 Tax=Comamonas testosteroni (strain DSM 14576 / KF-1) TaxID=399795 RepID=B7WRQ8_COMTK|nr:hypothetical protein CtesDRAFT_PD2189 [Comamonas testosteroni KF-1]
MSLYCLRLWRLSVPVKKRHNQNFNRGPQQQKECLHRIQPRGLKFLFPSHHLQIPIHVHNRCYVGQ